MKAANSTAAAKPAGLWVAVMAGAVLALLFWRCFLPDYVHFSNDGPLGMQNSACLRPPQAFTGFWGDLNSIGASGGAYPPSVTAVIRWALGPVGYAKFVAPITLWLAGICAWFFFRRLGLTRWACALGALAVVLLSDYLSAACWGVAPQVVAFGMVYLALGLVVSNGSPTAPLLRWARLALAGLAVGMNCVEAADIGALFSMMAAAYVVVQSLTEDGPLFLNAARGIGRTAILAGFAAFLAISTIIAVVGTQVKGTTAAAQDTEGQTEHWDWATQWSFPKAETLTLIVPGLFGYRMDTPKEMGTLGNWFEGANYWGKVGRDPAWDRYFAKGKEGSPPIGYMRFSGGGEYAGVAVVLVALWAALQSLRRQNSPFTLAQRKLLWFWMAVAIISLLLAFGRFAPFYRLLYALPYFSTMRNPAKFMHLLSFALTVLFAYGVHGLWRKYVEVPATRAPSLAERLKGWWAKAGAFDRRWVAGCGLALALSLLGWLIFASSRPTLEQYLQTVQFDGALAQTMAASSIHSVGWFVLFFVLAAGLLLLILAGTFAGQRARWGGVLLGLLVVFDLGRADLPWIIMWDYKEKYASNPVMDLLRDKPYEHRVAILPFRAPRELSLFYDVYRIEWSQQLFTYYDVQSIDVIQMPRPPADIAAFDTALRLDGTTNSMLHLRRRWELTNTRYLLGPAGFLELLNREFDPVRRRFRIAAAFDIVPKPGIAQPSGLQELTAVIKPEGQYALFDFTGALPRAALFTRWQVSTNDQAALETLASADFDPLQTVLTAEPLPAQPGGATNQLSVAEYTSYAPKRIVLSARAAAPAVLLLSDRYDPNWKVVVDGKPEKLLRCNYLMRGVYLAPGPHTVEFRFEPPVGTLYISLAAIGLALVLAGCVIGLERRSKPEASPPEVPPAGPKIPQAGTRGSK